MRCKLFKEDFGAVSRRSMRQDYKDTPNIQSKMKRPQIAKDTEINPRKRITELGERCEYLKFARYFIGKLVVCVNPGTGSGGWYEFVYDEDRKKLNEAAGWSDNKKQYLLTNPKFKDGKHK